MHTNKQPLLNLLIDFHKKCINDSGERVFEKERLQTLILKYLFCYMFKENWEYMFRHTFQQTKKLEAQILCLKTRGIPASCQPSESQLLSLMRLLYPMYQIHPQHKHLVLCSRPFPDEKVDLMVDFLEDIRTHDSKNVPGLALAMVSLGHEGLIRNFMLDREIISSLETTSSLIQRDIVPKLKHFRGNDSEEREEKINQLISMLKRTDVDIGVLLDRTHSFSKISSQISHSVLDINSQDYYHLIAGSVPNLSVDLGDLVNSICNLVSRNEQYLQNINEKKLSNEHGSTEVVRLKNLFQSLPHPNVLKSKDVHYLLNLQNNLESAIATLKKYQVSESDHVDRLAQDIRSKASFKSKLVKSVDRSNLYRAGKSKVAEHDDLTNIEYMDLTALTQLNAKLSDDVEILRAHQIK